jgi:hypothetical protein
MRREGETGGLSTESCTEDVLSEFYYSHIIYGLVGCD